MRRIGTGLKRLFGTLWEHRWFVLIGAVPMFFTFREFTPPSYRFVGQTAEVQNVLIPRGGAVMVAVERCNDTPFPAEFRYVRRMESRAGHIWPLDDGTSFLDPGCVASFGTMGDVPAALPPGQWRVKSQVQSANWLGRRVNVTFVSDWFEVTP